MGKDFSYTGQSHCTWSPKSQCWGIPPAHFLLRAYGKYWIHLDGLQTLSFPCMKPKVCLFLFGPIPKRGDPAVPKLFLVFLLGFISTKQLRQELINPFVRTTKQNEAPFSLYNYIFSHTWMLLYNITRGCNTLEKYVGIAFSQRVITEINNHEPKCLENHDKDRAMDIFFAISQSQM